MLGLSFARLDQDLLIQVIACKSQDSSGFSDTSAQLFVPLVLPCCFSCEGSKLPCFFHGDYAIVHSRSCSSCPCCCCITVLPLACKWSQCTPWSMLYTLHRFLLLLLLFPAEFGVAALLFAQISFFFLSFSPSSFLSVQQPKKRSQKAQKSRTKTAVFGNQTRWNEPQCESLAAYMCIQPHVHMSLTQLGTSSVAFQQEQCSEKPQRAASACFLLFHHFSLADLLFSFFCSFLLFCFLSFLFCDCFFIISCCFFSFFVDPSLAVGFRP